MSDSLLSVGLKIEVKKLKELNLLLNKFNKADIISKFIEESSVESSIKKQHHSYKKTKLVNEVICILTEKFSDLDELKLFIHFKHIFCERTAKKWKVFELKDAKRLQQGTEQVHKIVRSLFKYFQKYDVLCKAYQEQVGGCIWIMLYLGDDEPRRPIYLVIHTALSLVFLYNQRSTRNNFSEILPIIEKVVRKSLRASHMEQLKAISKTPDYFQTLNKNHLYVFQNRKRKSFSKQEVVPSKKVRQENSYSYVDDEVRQDDLSELVIQEAEETDNESIAVRKKAVKKDKPVLLIQEEGEADNDSIAVRKKAVEKDKPVLLIQEAEETDNESIAVRKKAVKIDKPVLLIQEEEEKGKASVTVSKKAVKKHKSVPVIQGTEETGDELVTVRKKAAKKDNKSKRIIKNSEKQEENGARAVTKDGVRKDNQSTIIKEADEIGNKVKIKAVKENSKSGMIVKQADKEDNTSTVRKKHSKSVMLLQESEETDDGSVTLRKKAINNGNKSGLIKEAENTHNKLSTLIKEEKREDDKKEPELQNPENQQLPKIECLTYYVTSFLPAKDNEDASFPTGCRIKFTGENVLKGLEIILASTDEPIPSQLYEDPKNTGQTEFDILVK